MALQSKILGRRLRFGGETRVGSEIEALFFLY